MKLANLSVTIYETEERAKRIIDFLKGDDSDGWNYRIEKKGHGFAIMAIDEDGIEMGLL